MPEFNITGWLDPALDYFAKQSGIPVADYSAQFGGEAYGNALEALADFFTKGWLNKVVQFITGATAAGYAIWAPGVSSRFRKEFLALGTHELFRFVDPTPSDIVEMRTSIDRTVDALGRGDWNAALASVLRTPTELQTMMGIVPQLTPTPAPTPGIRPPAPAPVPVPTATRYAVTEETPVVGTAARSRYTVSG